MPRRQRKILETKRKMWKENRKTKAMCLNEKSPTGLFKRNTNQKDSQSEKDKENKRSENNELNKKKIEKIKKMNKEKGWALKENGWWWNNSGVFILNARVKDETSLILKTCEKSKSRKKWRTTKVYWIIPKKNWFIINRFRGEKYPGEMTNCI